MTYARPLPTFQAGWVRALRPCGARGGRGGPSRLPVKGVLSWPLGRNMESDVRNFSAGGFPHARQALNCTCSRHSWDERGFHGLLRRTVVSVCGNNLGGLERPPWVSPGCKA